MLVVIRSSHDYFLLAYSCFSYLYLYKAQQKRPIVKHHVNCSLLHPLSKSYFGRVDALKLLFITITSLLQFLHLNFP